GYRVGQQSHHAQVLNVSHDCISDAWHGSLLQQVGEPMDLGGLLRPIQWGVDERVQAGESLVSLDLPAAGVIRLMRCGDQVSITKDLPVAFWAVECEQGDR